MFKSEAKSEFGTTAIISGAMETAIRYWMDIYSGRPDWVDPEDNIKTIKFAKSICSETARLVTLAIGVSFDGNRGDYMENWNNSAVMPHLRKWVEYGCAFGTIVLKPNGNGVDIVTPANFEVTEVDGMGKITGMRFQDRYKSGDNWYTKLEQHSFRTAKVRYEESGEYEDVTFYLIQNRAYISNNEAEIGKPIDLSMTKWSMLQPDVNGIKTGISNTLNAIKSVWDKIWGGLKTTVTNIFDAIWGAIKGVINSILGGIEGMANGVIGGINTVIGALNNLSFDVPDWVPVLGGKTFGFNITELSKVSLPRLANGGITTGATLAEIGEAGREAVLPLENNTGWMDELAGKLASRMPTYNTPTTLVMEVDGKAFAKCELPYFNAESQRIGVRLVTG